MKNVMSKGTMLVMVMVLASFGAFAQHDHAEHGNKMKMNKKMEPMFKNKDFGNAYSDYMHLKEALVASNSEEAKGAAVQLQKTLMSVENAKSAQAEAAKLASASDLDGRRTAFAALSNEIAILVKAHKLSTGEVYLEYCPMANGNSGAYWLSNQKEIRNPYFGDKMMTCGSVKETIK